MRRLLILVLSAFVCFEAAAAENWPEHQVSERDKALGAKAAEEYRQSGRTPRFDLANGPYTATAPYFEKRLNQYTREGPRRILDEDGVPMTVRGKNTYYSPVQVAGFSLAAYNESLNGGSAEPLIAGLECLMKMQRDDGALLYHYKMRHYTMRAPYAKPWASGLAQGMALSAFARGYHLTGDERYLEAGKRALAFLKTRHPDGPLTDLRDLDPSLKDYIFFQEFLTDPHVYTLNGFLLAVVGVYDWWQLTGSETAGSLFKRAIDTVTRILPYYDVGTFSTYDLSYITNQQPYLRPIDPHLDPSYPHRIHIEVLRALYSVTNEDVLKETADRWQFYVE